MANDQKKRRTLEKEAGKKKQCYEQGHFLPKLATKQCLDSPVDSGQYCAERGLAKRPLTKDAADTKKVRFARRLEFWTEYDKDTGVLLARENGDKTSDCRSSLRCHIRRKHVPRAKQNTMMDKPAKALKLTTRVKNISDAVQSVQRQRRGVNTTPKVSTDKYDGRFDMGGKEGGESKKIEYSVKLPQHYLKTNSVHENDWGFSKKTEKPYSDVVQERDDDCAPIPRRPVHITRSVQLRPSADFKACVQCTLPPLYDERNALDRRPLLTVAAGEEQVSTPGEHRLNSNKLEFGSLVYSNTPHIVQLFE